MRKLERSLTIASALVALTAWCHVSYGDPTGPGQGTWIGVTVKPLSEEWRDQWGYRGSGVLVTGVEANSPAEQAGITPGDLLVVVGSVSLWGADDLTLAKSRVDPTQSVPVVVARNNGRMIKIMNLPPVNQSEAIPVPAVPGNGDEPVAQSPSAAETPSLLQLTPKADATPAADATPGANTAPGADTAPKPDATPKPNATANTDSPSDRWTKFGTQCADLNPDLASALSVPVSRGVLVLQVTSGSFADRVGIRAGDVITAAGDQNIKSVADLQRALAGASTDLSVHVQRQNAGRDVNVSLESAPPPSAQDSILAPDKGRDEMRDELQALRREIERLRTQVEAKRGE